MDCCDDGTSISTSEKSLIRNYFTLNCNLTACCNVLSNLALHPPYGMKKNKAVAHRVITSWQYQEWHQLHHYSLRLPLHQVTCLVGISNPARAHLPRAITRLACDSFLSATSLKYLLIAPARSPSFKSKILASSLGTSEISTSKPGNMKSVTPRRFRQKNEMK
jgi:hypothetical protein